MKRPNLKLIEETAYKNYPFISALCGVPVLLRWIKVPEARLKKVRTTRD